MIKSGERILAAIDDTLDQLIENADVIKKISLNATYASEVEALQKTQESLLARLIHVDDLLKSHRKTEEEPNAFDRIEEKILRFGKLNAQMMNKAAAKIRRAKKSRTPRVRPHRKKSIIPVSKT